MSEPIDLDNYREHKNGFVICQGCFHRWVGVAPVGTMILECPDCGCMEGRMLDDGPADPREKMT